MLTKLLERFDPEQFRVRESPIRAIRARVRRRARGRRRYALARPGVGWPRRRTSASSVESPCEVGTISGKRSLLGIILAGKQNFHRL